MFKKLLSSILTRRKPIVFALSFIAILGSLLFVASYLLAAPNIEIIQEPAPKSNGAPNVVASSTADTGRTIQNAQYQLYPAGESPSGTLNSCTPNSGFAFGSQYIEFTCGSATANNGNWQMNIIVTDDNSQNSSVQTNSFIVDVSAPIVNIDDLPASNPILITYNNPVFTGTVVDNLTFIDNVEYVTLTSSSTGGTWDLTGATWTACTNLTGSATTINFECNPPAFADSVKGDEYRVYIRSKDEVGNQGTPSYYRFNVDTQDPYNLSITQPNAAGIVLYGGQSYSIEWVAPLDAYEIGATPISIEYSSNGLFTDTVSVAVNRSPNGPYPWTVPTGGDTTTARIRITATDLAGNSISVTSANPFTIIPSSIPSVNIHDINAYPYPTDATTSNPIYITATASDPEGIASGSYRLDYASWILCSAQDGSFGGTTEVLVCGPMTITPEGGHVVEVVAVDNGVGDSGSDTYYFTYDASPPIVEAGTLGTINLPTEPGAWASEAYTSIKSYSWVFVSGPGTIYFSDNDIENPYISANTYSVSPYTARLTVCDVLDNCDSDDVTFTWTDQPLSFSVYNPSGGERLAGGNTFNSIQWTSPGGAALDHFDLEYSVNGGSNWTTLVNDLSNVTTSYSWSIPYENSENVFIRVNANDSSNTTLVSADSSPFAIDSTDPTVDAGTLGAISSATAPGATASDNYFDSTAQLSYSWTKESGPGASNSIIFSSSSSLNPTIRGTITGSYVARLTVTDRAGNSATDTVSFDWDGNPPDFSVINPSTGDYLAGGSTIPVTWEISASASYYNIYYTLNNWVSSSSIALSTNGTLSGGTRYYNWTVPVTNTSQAAVRVTSVDAYGNQASANTGLFTIDSIPPTVDAGNFYNVVLGPTQPGASSSDSGSGIASHTWKKISGPGTISFGGGSNILNPSIYADQPGIYVAGLTVTDNVGLSAYDEVAFIANTNPPTVIITSPGVGTYWRGETNRNIQWTLDIDPGNLGNFRIDYSINNGSSWTNISNSVASTSRLFNWTVPMVSSETSLMRVITTNTEGGTATATNQFVLDSEAPVITIGEIGTTTIATTTGTTVTDNIDEPNELTYIWSAVIVPAGGTLVFSPSNTIMDPLMSGTVTGYYTAQIIVSDTAGHISTDFITFYWEGNPEIPIITNPTSTTIIKGGDTKLIEWYMPEPDPGDLDHFDVSYSLDGLTWNLITSGLSSTTRDYLWTSPEGLNSTSTTIKIEVYDTVDNLSYGVSPNFTIDSTPPVVNTGTISSPISAATSSIGVFAVDNFDDEEFITFNWTILSEPYANATLTIASSTDIGTEFYGDVSGTYEALLSATDRAGNVGTSSLSFVWLNEYDPVLIEPKTGDHIKGNSTSTAIWTFNDSGDIDHIETFYSIDNGDNWTTVDSNIASTSMSIVWDVPGANSSSSLFRVVTVDNLGRRGTSTSGLFTIDSEAPVVDAGILGDIDLPTNPNASATDNFDDESEMLYFWTKNSGPGDDNSIIFSDDNILNPSIFGTITDSYTALLTVIDRAGNSATDTVSFNWDGNPPEFSVISPTSSDYFAGSSTVPVVWEVSEGAIYYDIYYTLDNWTSSSSIAIATSGVLVDENLSYDWLTPSANTDQAAVRVTAIDIYENRTSAYTGLFIIDSAPPFVDAGSLTSPVNSPAVPNATSTDNFSSPEEITYLWTPSSLNFGGGNNILNPSISANSNGTYTATLTAYDKVGNYASDTVVFNRNVSGGGPGGPSTTTCSEVTYGDWSACFNGFQTRSIISSVPSSCTPTAEQQALQTQVCGGEELNYCSEVIYGEWGECINGWQLRPIVNRSPANCIYTEAQELARGKSCGGEPFDIDALDVMEQARKDFTGEDPALVKRLMGQILIQVEELGRAWYVNPNDGRRYYLGSPTNAFSVMSLIGKGIKNDLLKKLPIGLLDPKLSNDKDTDGDGLTDRLEEGVGTDLFKKDTDGDGFSDYEEVMAGYDPLDPAPKKSIIDQKLLAANLGQIFIQVETNGEAWYVEPRSKKRYYLGRPLEAFNIMRQFGVGITNKDLNKIPVGQFTETQMKKITEMLEERKRRIEAEAAAKK